MTQYIDNDEKEGISPDYTCDVLIIGAGFAGAVTAYELKRKVPEAHIIVMDKRYPGSHEASYSIPFEIVEKLDLTFMIRNHITENTYEIDSNDYKTVSDLYGENGGLATLSYTEICRNLLDGIEYVKGIFVKMLDSRTIITQNGDTYQANIIIDATGWESPIRRQLGLRIPKIGAKTVLFKVENCNVSHPNRMKLAVGDFASYGFWAEPQGDDVMLAGSGYWDELHHTISGDKIKLENLLLKYLDTYPEIFAEANVTERHFARVAVDPVKQVVSDRVISVGESAGMSNPYWTLGAGHITDFIFDIMNHLVYALQDPASIDKQMKNVQKVWRGMRSKYRKNWAAARVIWNQHADGWQSIFENREQLDEYTDPNKLVERQQNGSYGTRYAFKLMGFKRIMKTVYYMGIFNLRMLSQSFYDWYQFNYREPSIYNWEELAEEVSSLRAQYGIDRIDTRSPYIAVV